MGYRRSDGRAADELRPVLITPHYLSYAEGSALIDVGNTRVLCSASAEDNVPSFRKGTGSGWITSEYSLLPRSTHVRTPRESSRGRVAGRTHEIQRTIGRALRAVTNLDLLGERTIWIDCDVIQADGGTRTASITGAYVALALALAGLRKEGYIEGDPLAGQVAAVSVGIVDGLTVLDLNYEEDSISEVDLNVAKTGDGRFVDIQGTAESKPFDREQLQAMLDLAGSGIERLLSFQREALA
jgi:ribonuclease PH